MRYFLGKVTLDCHVQNALGSVPILGTEVLRKGGKRTSKTLEDLEAFHEHSTVYTHVHKR